MTKTELLIKRYGITTNTSNAGFITPDGKMIDLKRSENRIYHEQTLSTFGKDENLDNLIILLKEERLIRFCLGGVIHIENKPTEAQLKLLLSITKYRSFPFELIKHNRVTKQLISNMKTLRILTSDISYQGDKVIIIKESEHLIAIDGDLETPLAIYIPRTNKLLFNQLGSEKYQADVINAFKKRNILPLIELSQLKENY